MPLEWIATIPAGCPKALVHPLGKPSAKFPYLNADGSKSWAVYRWDGPQGKEIRPLSLWRDEGGALVWAWKYPSSPRGLYNGDQLHKRPDAPVLICEGEKTCDAAEILFPEWVSTTSGSATSAKSSNWSPLQGRRCVIWRDHDEPGQSYAEAVSEAARKAGAASIAVVNVPESFPESWDLADTPPEGWNVNRLFELLETAKPVGQSPAMEKTPSLRTIQTWTAGELLDLPKVEPRWAWEGWIPRAKVGMLVAVGDHGKTALALQLGAAIATGRPFMGFPTSGKPLGVLVASFEDDAQEDLGPRLRLVLDGMPGLNSEEKQSLRTGFRVSNPTWTGPDILFQGLRPELERELEAMRQDGIEPGLVVLETLQAITDGDENAADSTRKLWNQARALAKTFDVTVIISHHLKKESNTGKNRAGLYEKLETDRIRGSSANEGAARFVLQLASIRPDEAGRAGLDEQKALAKGYAILRASKIKAAKPPHLFLERIGAGEPGEHCWKKHPEGDRIIAELLQSATACEKVTQDEALLKALWELRDNPEREAVKLRAFPDLEPKKAETALKNGLQHLRTKGWLTKARSSLQLTLEGTEQALRICPRIPISEDENLTLERAFEDEPDSLDSPSDTTIRESSTRIDSYSLLEPLAIYPSEERPFGGMAV